ncbi:MAG: hypothetical protein Q8R64_00145, partial [Sulfurimicrobium sp.]|nr:hypothetical protein [Sulfurimicrobium sp.]
VLRRANRGLSPVVLRLSFIGAVAVRLVLMRRNALRLLTPYRMRLTRVGESGCNEIVLPWCQNIRRNNDYAPRWLWVMESIETDPIDLRLTRVAASKARLLLSAPTGYWARLPSLSWRITVFDHIVSISVQI